MAQAVKRLFPAVKLAIGPAIEDGFYYDFGKAEPFTPEDLARIEEVMREIAKADFRFERQELGRTDAIRFFRERGDEKNPMLQRIYGTAWLTQEELDTHLWRLD